MPGCAAVTLSATVANAMTKVHTDQPSRQQAPTACTPSACYLCSCAAGGQDPVEPVAGSTITYSDRICTIVTHRACVGRALPLPNVLLLLLLGVSAKRPGSALQAARLMLQSAACSKVHAAMECVVLSGSVRLHRILCLWPYVLSVVRCKAVQASSSGCTMHGKQGRSTLTHLRFSSQCRYVSDYQ
jgi:hypothetical protein